MIEINITAGEEMNKLLKNKFPEKAFVPFNEAMIKGKYTSTDLFSKEFIAQRAIVHNVSISSYKENMKEFLILLSNLNNYSLITLWFGDEPFCNANKNAIIKTLIQYGYHQKLILNTVNEYTLEIMKVEKIKTFPEER